MTVVAEVRRVEWGEFLRRFRPSGVPGSAAGTAVPADRRARVGAEVAELLGTLDGTQEEADRVRAEGQEEAARVRATAARSAELLLDRARRRAADVEREAADRRPELPAADAGPGSSPATEAVMADLVTRATGLVEALLARPGTSARPGGDGA